MAAPGDVHAMRGVLAVPAFRRLWVALTFSSFGDWLGLLALTALATSLAGGSYAKANVAVATVFILRLAPAVVLGPLAGAVADRLDRRWTMVVCDVLRFLLFLSIPLVGTLTWLFVATFLIECAAMFWIPAKEASVPNLVPRERLETANQLSLLTTYGSAPVAAALFALLTVAGGPASRHGIDVIDLAVYVDAATFLVSAATISRLRAIPGRPDGREARPTVWRTIIDGWRFVGRTPLVRGLVVGMLGAFAAGGAVVGLARTHVADLGAGDPGYGVLFAAVFLGLAAGMAFGPRLVHGFSRRRLFGLGITAAGASLAVLALLPDMVLAALATGVLGFFAGVAWVTGYTLLGLEVSDELRGRTFAFVQSMVRIVLVAVLAVAPLVAAAIGRHSVEVGDTQVTYSGAAIVFFVSGLLAAGLGITSLRQMDDRRGTPLIADLVAALRGGALQAPVPGPGFLLALEGGDGAGKSTQAQLLADWLTGLGHDVVVTREPGATEVGARIRAMVLDPATGQLDDRAEALLYAADRAQHVATVVRPALIRGAVVITDRYVDSSIAYQGAGRALPAAEVARLSTWATDDLVPGLTVLLDVSPGLGAERRAGAADDRLEAESVAFHERVRQGFLALAAARPERYLVLDAALAAPVVHEAVQRRLGPLLPVSAAASAATEAAAAADRRRASDEGRRREQARQQRVGAARAQVAQRRAREAAEVAAHDEERRRQEAERLRLRAAAQSEDARRRAAEAQETARMQAEGLELQAEVQARVKALSEERRSAALAQQQAREALDRQAEREHVQRSVAQQARHAAQARARDAVRLHDARDLPDLAGGAAAGAPGPAPETVVLDLRAEQPGEPARAHRDRWVAFDREQELSRSAGRARRREVAPADRGGVQVAESGDASLSDELFSLAGDRFEEIHEIASPREPRERRWRGLGRLRSGDR